MRERRDGGRAGLGWLEETIEPGPGERQIPLGPRLSLTTSVKSRYLWFWSWIYPWGCVGAATRRLVINADSVPFIGVTPHVLSPMIPPPRHMHPHSLDSSFTGFLTVLSGICTCCLLYLNALLPGIQVACLLPHRLLVFPRCPLPTEAGLSPCWKLPSPPNPHTLRTLFVWFLH